VVAFVAGYALVFASLCALAIYEPAQVQGLSLFAPADQTWGLPAVTLFVLPVAAAWITLDVLNRLRGRRWFDYRVKRRTRLLSLGFGAGLVAAVECTILLAWGEQYVPAWVIVAVCTVLAVAGAFVLIPGIRAGHCILCGYQLADGGFAGRCPECGSLDPL
jgi:hypothetical protein